MTQLEQNALNFVRKMQYLYYEKRDVQGIKQGLLPYSSWIGTGEWEIIKNYKEGEIALTADMNDCPTGFSISNLWYETEPVSDTVCLVYGGMSVSSATKTDRLLEQRLSALCMETEEGMKLLHIHVSRPDYDLQEGNFYIKNTIKMDNRAARNMMEAASKKLALKNQELMHFTENIPGGMICCLHDRYFTLLNMSRNFFQLCGYTQQEMEDHFQNQFIHLIHESDRERIVWECEKKFKQGKDVEIEFRLICKGGHIIWVMERGKVVEDIYGKQVLYSILLDITERKREQEELRLSLERHQIIMNQADDIVFEWDILKDVLYISSNWEKKFGYKPCSSDVTQLLPTSNNIKQEDMSLFLKFMEDVRDGVPYSETEFRIRRQDNSYVWCRVRATTQYNKNKKAIKAVGVITDIDVEKKHEQALLEQAQKDSLTGLFHKAAIQKHVREHLICCSHDEKSALMIIDLDRFKFINDNYGHLCGDAILSDTALALKKLFRSSDYIGRIGGDEFLVYMKNVSMKDAVAEKALEVQKELQKISLKEIMDTGIQCSIGIAFFPEDAVDYVGLYKCADNALYYVKNHGRDNFAFFEDSSRGVNFFVDKMNTAVGDYIDSQLEGVDEALTQYTFRMLYEAVDINAAVGQLLEIVGRAYDVSRMYIFENTEDDCFCNNTFEWCNDGVTPQIENLQMISYKDDLGGYWNNFDDNGIFYCQDIQKLSKELYNILAPQGITSILQCAIIDEGQYKDYVGFDECRTNRYWTKHQIRSLSVISNVLSAFLMKLRLKERLIRLEGKRS